MKRTLNQRGFSTSMILIAVLAIAILGGGAYYFFSKQNDKSTSSKGSNTAETKALNEACKSYIDDEDYCRFASNWSSDGSMTVVITSSDDGSVMTLRTNGTDSHSVFERNGEVMTETINLNNVMYMKNADNTWMKFENQLDTNDNSVSDFVPDFSFDSDDETSTAANTEKIEKLGKEACGNLTCFKYAMSDSSDPDSKTIIWFDDKDYKVRRMTTSSADGSSDMTFNYDAVTITEPSPIVDSPSL